MHPASSNVRLEAYGASPLCRLINFGRTANLERGDGNNGLASAFLNDDEYVDEWKDEAFPQQIFDSN